MSAFATAYAGRRVLVLGGTGFIGARVCRRLAAAGAELHLALRPGSAAPPGVTTHPADLAAPGAARDLVAALRPAVSFSLAGYGVRAGQADPGLLGRLNAELPAELAAACAAAPDPSWPGQRLVHAGSAAEYGGAGGELAESGPAEPVSPYGASKLAGTRGVLAAGPARACVARLFTVYGPGEPPGRLLPSLLRAAAAGGPVPLSTGTQRRDFTFVDDVAEGLLRLGALPDPAAGVVNLATGVLTPVREFAERAARVIGLAPDRLRFGALPGRPDELVHEPLRLDRLTRLTRWRPSTGIEAGVRETLAAGYLAAAPSHLRTEP